MLGLVWLRSVISFLYFITQKLGTCCIYKQALTGTAAVPVSCAFTKTSTDVKYNKCSVYYNKHYLYWFGGIVLQIYFALCFTSMFTVLTLIRCSTNIT